jgi:hypothetical protein
LQVAGYVRVAACYWLTTSRESLLSRLTGDLSILWGGIAMRAPYAFTLIAAIVVGIALKLFFFSAPPAEADVRAGFGLDVSKMHQNQNLPMQKMHDMSFVFSDGD